MNRMLAGIISDTHDNRTNIVRAVELFNRTGVSLVIHGGDMVAPFTALDFKALNCPMEMVFGNNDGERIGLVNSFRGIGNLLPGPRTFSFQGKKFLLMHEPGCLDDVAALPAWMLSSTATPMTLTCVRAIRWLLTPGKPAAG